MIRGPFKPHEYGLVILPMTVVKRFHDCLLPTHDNVLAQYEKVKHLAVIDGFLTRASGYQFYNTSKFTFETLLADPDNIETNFKDYLAGFSANAQDVLSKFDFDNIIKRMVESNTLYLIIKVFNSEKSYLGADKISAVDCGYIFEDFVRRFSESFGEEAGAHFTSRFVEKINSIKVNDSLYIERGEKGKLGLAEVHTIYIIENGNKNKLYYPVDKFRNSCFNFIPAVKENVVNHGVFKPAPQFFDFVKVWAVWRQENKLQAFTVFKFTYLVIYKHCRQKGIGFMRGTDRCTNVKFCMEDENQRRAWEYLHGLSCRDGSYGKVLADALIAIFVRRTVQGTWIVGYYSIGTKR